MKHPESKCIDCQKPVCYGYPTPKRCAECYHEFRYLSPVDKFWKYVEKTESCWLWIGAKTRGYGAFTVMGKTYAAHKFSYELHKGKIKKGKIVCHDCPGGDNPCCVNPDHLYAGTYSDNNSDSVRKGGAPTGEKKPNAKLTDEQVRELKANYVKRYGANVMWAKRFGVKVAIIDAIVTGRNYRYVH